ncbi:MAG: twin-arginine translocase TatA/TatE family subunit [Rickettsiales bacterium]|nr:twin-arginine translocase TatA/TatE family subunit [Rickettsiales bacterium]
MSIGIWQLVLILAIILIIFGGGKIPRLLGDFGKGIKNFKKEVKPEIADENSEKEKE